MVAPAVASDKVTDRAEVYVPGAGENTGVADVEEAMVMATLVTQELPLAPQALTCKVCAPEAATIEAFTD